MSFVSARLKAGMTQVETAKALNITDSAVCQWETGKTVPRLPMLRKLAALYGCTVDDLLAEPNTSAQKGGRTNL